MYKKILTILRSIRLFFWTYIDVCTIKSHELTHYGDMKRASSRENLSSEVCEQQGADQPAHPRSLISAFVIRCLESTISKLTTSEFSTF